MGSQKIFIFDFFKKFNKSNIFNIIIAQKKSVNKKNSPGSSELFLVTYLNLVDNHNKPFW